MFTATCLAPLPYYIYNGGGTINVDKKVKIEDSYKGNGSFNLCYVSEIRATLPTYLLAKILPSWDLTPKEEITLNEDETDKDVYTRDRIFLDDANVNAIHLAYQKAGKDFTITKKNHYIIYIDENASTNLKIGDIIRTVDKQVISSLEEIKEIVSKKEVGEQISFTVERNKKIKECYATVYENNGNKYVGISMQTTYDYDTNPDISLKFSSIVSRLSSRVSLKFFRIVSLESSIVSLKTSFKNCCELKSSSCKYFLSNSVTKSFSF